MGNIIDYVREHGDISFLQEPLNEVDSLVLCQMVYMNFGRFVPGLEERNQLISIQDIYHHPDRDHLLDDYWYKQYNKELFEAAAASRRFGTLKMNYYVNVINVDDETQFSAITYILENKETYIAYRGTDATIIGWKEDLNLAFSKPLSSQHLSVAYMDKVSSWIAGPFYAGGHSKGGNLAIYASMYCNPRIQNKITRIYSMDGPGFRPETLQQGHYDVIRDRVTKILPHSSMVGMLFEKKADFEIVESSVTGLMQHYPLTWVVQGDRFVKVSKLYEPAHFLDDTINEWIYSLDEEHIRIFVDTLFEVLYASESDNLIDFTADWMKSMQKVFSALSDLDEQTKEAVKSVIKAFFEMGRYHMKEEMTGLLKNTKAKIEGEGL